MIRDDEEQEFKFGDDHAGEHNQFFDHRGGLTLNRDADREELER